MAGDARALLKNVSTAVDVETVVSVNYFTRSSFCGKALTLYMERKEEPDLYSSLHTS